MNVRYLSIYLGLNFFSAEFYSFTYIEPEHILFDLFLNLSFGVNINGIVF